MRRAGLAAVVAVTAVACGGGDPKPLDVAVAEAEGGLVDLVDYDCRRADNQLVADGVVRNGGDNPHYVSISVRFVDADGVRVELATASIGDLQPAESARWDATVYAAADAADVVACEIDAEAG